MNKLFKRTYSDCMELSIIKGYITNAIKLNIINLIVSINYGTIDNFINKILFRFIDNNDKSKKYRDRIKVYKKLLNKYIANNRDRIINEIFSVIITICDINTFEKYLKIYGNN